jgi:cytidine deaminase
MNKKLIDKAIISMDKAYAPYSHFKVGAAVLTASGKIYTGSNIENSSYGASVCAERVAIFKAVADGEMEIIEIAVATETEEPSSPCGICRQVMAEFARNAKIYLVNRKRRVIETSFKELLPLAFTIENLKSINKEKK